MLERGMEECKSELNEDVDTRKFIIDVDEIGLDNINAQNI